MEIKKLVFAELPDFVFPDAPHRGAIFEAIALAGLEGQWIRLSADTQRRLMGHPVFGKQAFRVLDNGNIEVTYKNCFGSNSEFQEYTATYLWAAAEAKKCVSPGASGGKYYSGPVRNHAYD